MDNAKYAQLFLTESRDQLLEINNALLELEQGESEASVARLFRAVHSMKGMSAAMGYDSVSELAHELETLFDRLRGGTLLVTPLIVDTLFAAADALEHAVSLATGVPTQNVDVSAVVERIRLAGAESPQTFTSEFAVAAQEKGTPSAHARTGPRHIRIDARRLDALMDMAGELVIARDRLAQIAATIGDASLLDATLQASQIITTLQNEIMTSRMVPVWQVFDRFPRLVRDTARSLGKEVDFRIEGKEIELDRSMVDEMGEPVLHLLRNSLDHGIESPAERKAAGKPAVATVTLTAERDRTTVVIRVTDDGRGIDKTRVLPRAIELGLVDRSTTDISDEELIRLISRPGFSTADRVTDISGRGVGFDVVATRVRLLGGSLEVHTTAGAGTSVGMRMPLTLAIARALLARVERETYAIPLTHVVETFALSEPMLLESKGREHLVMRDDAFPTVRLRERVGLPPSDRGGQVVLVELAERRVALIVDEFLGQQEIVVKQFDGVAGSRNLFSGATILGDGAPALIIDASTLL
ncbi:MAG TPA: chemotaxis protein CheA [Gemmatimonadaceae bacterium]|nr:chemotaxis protein CheA [Gemmatimonadaceae bacterium]